MTEVRWDEHARAHRDVVRLRAAADPLLLSVGGGGENRCGRWLTGVPRATLVVDPSFRQLARQEFPAGIPAVAALGVAEALPVATGTVDVVEMQGVIDHVEDVDRALGEALRALVPGGLVTVTVTNDGAWYKRVARLFGVERDDSHVHAHHFDPQSLCDRLELRGFVLPMVLSVAYVRLPLGVERFLARFLRRRSLERVVRVSDALLRRVLGAGAGGMMVVSALRPVDGRVPHDDRGAPLP